MKNYYIVTYVDGGTEMCGTKKELAELINYSYSYINLCFDRGYFVFMNGVNIYTIKEVKNGHTTKIIKRK